jgi:hypothetical protein
MERVTELQPVAAINQVVTTPLRQRIQGQDDSVTISGKNIFEVFEAGEENPEKFSSLANYGAPPTGATPPPGYGAPPPGAPAGHGAPLDAETLHVEYVLKKTSETSDSLPLSPKPRRKIDYFVLAIVISAAIVFSVFQIRECVFAHSSPSSQSRSLYQSRMFPGIMVCPHASPPGEYSALRSYCPKWDRDASLSFNYGGRIPRAFNTNVNFRESGRLQSVCPMNMRNVHNSISFTGETFSLFFANLTKGSYNENGLSFAQEMLIENSPDSEPQNALQCLRWTPPNVKCLVFDPFLFDKMAEKYGINNNCNPMRETAPNSFDSFQLAFDIPDTVYHSPGFDTAPKQGFEYRGLIPPTTSEVFDGAPPSRFISMHDLQSQLKSANQIYNNLNFTFFGGLMIVLYDPSEGVPKKLDFNAAPVIVNNQEGSFATSQKFVFKTYKQQGQHFSFVKPIGPTIVAVGSAVKKTFTNAIFNQMQETFSYFFTFSFSIETKYSNDESYFDFSLQFVSSISTLTEEVVKISVLTTISIILSTTATLWGSQEKITEGLLLIYAKMQMAREKK